MDCKVAGTATGITALQMDIMRKALEQARQGRMHILGKMTETLGAERPDISTCAPRIITIRIPVEKIRERIGSGGKTIRSNRHHSTERARRRARAFSADRDAGT